MVERLKPPMLQPGDVIGIASPSWGGAGLYPLRAGQGVRGLQSLGFQARFAANALDHAGYVSDTPESRAADLHELFADPQVKAIIAAIGGDHACHLLPHLDFDLIRRHPKIFIGFSDNTVLNVALYQQIGLVTFNGPMLLTDFAEQPHIQPYTLEYFRRAVCRAAAIGEIFPAAAWTEARQDWTSASQPPRVLQPSPGWQRLKPGLGQGRLIGGCIESLQHLRGTPYWPDWQDAILFLETSEDRPSPADVDGILMDYQNMGVFERLQGLLFGRPMSYSAEECAALRAVILERTKHYRFPVISDMDFGHTAPSFTLPLGCQARIGERFEIIEAAVAVV